MTTLLTQRQMDAIRSVGDCMYLLVILFGIDCNHPGRSTTLNEMKPLVYPVIKDNRKLEQQLNSLCASSRLTRTGAGYVLVEGGRALMLDFFGRRTPTAEEFEIAKKDLALSPVVETGTVIEAQALVENEPHTDKNALARNFRALEEVEEELTLTINLDSDSSTPTPERAEISHDLPSVRRMLEKTPLLFDGAEVITKDLQLDVIDPFEALAILAHCYAGRKTNENPKGFHTPAGMAYRMLLQGRRGRTEFRLAPMEHLPEPYLEALGMMDYRCDVCDQTFKTRAEFESHDGMLLVCKYGCGRRFHGESEQEAHHANDHILERLEVGTYTRLADTERGAKAWAMARNELAGELPKPSFETWVRDVEAVGFDGKTLTLAVRNAYARDWLESRLKDMIEAMLKAFTRQTLAVAFVVGVVTEDDHDLE